MNELCPAIEAVLFAAGESVPTARLSLIFGTDEAVILSCIDELNNNYRSRSGGICILKLDDKLQMCSVPEYAPVITKVLEQRKPPKLSQAALETLAVIAYFQPVTRAFIEQVRGVDSSYSVAMLQERGLITECGKLEAPGRPALFRTTDSFLRVMGVSSLSELPALPEVNGGDGIEKLQNAIAALQKTSSNEQLSIDAVSEDNGE